MRLLTVCVMFCSMMILIDATVVDVASDCSKYGIKSPQCISSSAQYLYNVFIGIAGWSGGTRTKNAFGGQCTGEYDGGWHNWQWKYDASVICPHVSSSIRGYSTKHKSRDGAINGAMHDYTTKVTQTGLLTSRHIASYNLGYLLPETTTTTTNFPQSLSSHSFQTNKAQQLALSYTMIITLLIVLIFLFGE
ncbi:hypothetical protein I4U23_031528 [Adineta vaga]|nr:hypothetical protein I4U23_031528 [Adineta vaga]